MTEKLKQGNKEQYFDNIIIVLLKFSSSPNTIESNFFRAMKKATLEKKSRI